VFADINLQFPNTTSLKNLKDLKQKALQPLAEGSPNVRFIYIPPTYDLNEEGDIRHDDEGRSIILAPARKPFYSPYIISVFQQLWFGEKPRFKNVPLNITVPQLSFVCGLASFFFFFF